ncbi:LysR family transcriptional regulator [Rubrivivax gelatinosus]|nr:LysR family transcriptional regulator [Rubrivivax gelatinosus]
MSINVSFKLLKAFLTLTELKNFTRAAEHCHVSQSTFSGMIQRLENEVGTRLFARDTRNVVLTPEGALFAEAAAHLVSEIEWTFSDLSDFVAKKKGRVGIATLPSIAGDWLPPVIAEYRRRHPGIAVEIFDVLSDNCIELLNKGDADIALAAPNAALEEYETEHFHTDRFFLICRRDHRVARMASVSLEDLSGCDFIRLSRSTSVHQHIVNAVGATGVTSSSFEVKYLSTVAGLILHGLGVSLLPDLTLPQFRHPDLVAVPLTPPGISRPIHIIRRKDKPLSIAADAMLQLIRERKHALAG